MIERSATVSQEPYYSLVRFAAARQFDATSTKVFSIRLGITFTEEWETELMLHFVRAAITTSLLRAVANQHECTPFADVDHGRPGRGADSAGARGDCYRACRRIHGTWECAS